MWQRILTAMIGLVFLFLILFSNTVVFHCAATVIIFAVLFELYKATKANRWVAAVGMINSALILWGAYHHAAQLYIILSIILYLILSVYLHPEVHYEKLYSSAFATYFITLFLLPLMQIRSDYGIEAVLLVFLFSWMTDTGAYFAGRFFGKHKLIPSVSPKKTVEGAIGGVVVAILSAWLYFWILEHFRSMESIAGIRYQKLMILGVIASIMSQFGDLAASVIKRDCGVKDFGSILPGHGGVLDRFDSVIVVTPLVYYFLMYVNR